jgi:putative DNA methylase
MEIPRQLVLDFSKTTHCFDDGSFPNSSDFPESYANILAEKESYNKHLYRPNTYLHKWWARRSGTTFRFILKQLVQNLSKRSYYEPGGLEGKIILDPMIGGGTTLHEAIRLGANVVGIDVDPIPILQAKATLNWIPVQNKQKIFSDFFGTVRDLLYKYYSTYCPFCHGVSEVQYYLSALRKHCDCGENLFVDSLTLRENSNNSNIMLCNICGQVICEKDGHGCNKSSSVKFLTKKHQDAMFVGKYTRNFRTNLFTTVMSILQ